MSSIGLDFPQKSSATGTCISHRSSSKTCVNTSASPRISPPLITQEQMDNQSAQTSGLNNISTFGQMPNRQIGPLTFLWQNLHTTRGIMKPHGHPPSIPSWGITHEQHGKYQRHQ